MDPIVDQGIKNNDSTIIEGSINLLEEETSDSFSSEHTVDLQKEASCTEENFSRIFGTALRIVLVSSSLSQVLEQEMNTCTISFVYSAEPMGCHLHKNCPMRFHTEDMRSKHYVESHGGGGGGDVTLYQCRSCSRSNRQMLFASKADLIEHKRNPTIFCGVASAAKDSK